MNVWRFSFHDPWTVMGVWTATVDFIFFYAKLWTFAYEKPMVKKVWKNMKNQVMVLPSSPKSKRGGQVFGILAISTTPIFWGLWGAFSRHVCTVTAGRNDNFVGQRPLAANSISCARLARSTAAVASTERTLNSMRWSSAARPCAREVGSRRATTADAPHTFWPCSGVASLVNLVKERHLQFFWPLLFDCFLNRKVS